MQLRGESDQEKEKELQVRCVARKEESAYRTSRLALVGKSSLAPRIEERRRNADHPQPIAALGVLISAYSAPPATRQIVHVR